MELLSAGGTTGGVSTACSGRADDVTRALHRQTWRPRDKVLNIYYYIIIIIIIIGLRSVSASEDVIGDPSRPGTNNNVLLDPGREEREKVMGKADQFPF